jgi:hypothetical protein
MRGDVLVSSVRLCEIVIVVKYTQLAVADKKLASGYHTNIHEKPREKLSGKLLPDHTLWFAIVVLLFHFGLILDPVFSIGQMNTSS